MRTMSAGLAAHLAGDATTICHCWRVTRRDGTVLGFTDHDRDLLLDGETYAAGSGFEASTAEEAAGLSAHGSDVRGGFSSAAITEADIAAGRYDGARVEVYRVNWARPEDRVLLKVEVIGEVTRTGADFTAELRPFAHGLSQSKGRIYARSCSASLGDTACGLALADGVHRAGGTVAAVASESRLALAVSGSFAAGAFARGTVRFLSGALRGSTMDIAAEARGPGTVIIDLWLPMPASPAPGDAAEITVGCDKSFATCRSTFGNGQNFQGFPHLPGPDFAYSYADRDTVHDGGALFP